MRPLSEYINTEGLSHDPFNSPEFIAPAVKCIPLRPFQRLPFATTAVAKGADTAPESRYDPPKAAAV